MRGVITGACAIVAALVSLLAAIGMVRHPAVLARTHFLGPASTVGALAIGAAIAVQEGWKAATEESLVAVLLIMLSGPALGHVIAAATRSER